MFSLFIPKCIEFIHSFHNKITPNIQIKSAIQQMVSLFSELGFH